jgi:hypothetical protein
LHPYVAGSLVALHLGLGGRFNPSQGALILDSNHQLGAPLEDADRHAFQDRLNELVRNGSAADVLTGERGWAFLHSAAEATLDASGKPALEVRVSGEVTSVGIARANILSGMGSEFAAGLVKARLRAELKSASGKMARADVENDLALLQELLTQPRGSASTAGPTTESAAVTFALP